MPLPGMGEGFFTLAKNTLISAFLALPIIFIIISGFFATTTANIGMMILFLMQIIGIPLVQTLLTWLRGIPFIYRAFSQTSRLTYDNFSNLCSLSPGEVKGDQWVPPVSYWMAHILFFGTYLLSNSMTVYLAEAETTSADPLKVENRKAQVLTGFILTIIFVISAIVIQMMYVGCDTIGSLALGLLVYVPAGYFSFTLAELCGIRTADIFGIASKLFLPGPGDNSYPYACVNIERS
jgi:hypothetical protein